MSDEIETIESNPKSWGAWKREAERLQKIIDDAANREAQPVAWTDAQELRDVEKDGCGYLFKANPITPHADPRRVIKLYTAPPAPAVPDERKAFEAWFASDYSPDASGKSSMGERVFQGVLWHVWQARAMLAQPVSVSYRLVPVEPTSQVIAPFIKHCCENEVWVRQAWREMLAAAPEGGNG